MRFEIDQDEKTVEFSIPRKIYSREALEIAAQIFAPRAEVYLDESASAFALTLKSKRGEPSKADLETLAGEFLNELLNQDYRFLVGRFNQKISSLVVTQALLAARGGEKPAETPAAERTPEFEAEVARLMDEAREEISRTMPRKIAPQGLPLPPAPEEVGA